MTVFGSGYAAVYDLLYEDKDYDGECDIIEALIEKYGLKPSRSIVDLGCGTGNHALRLAGRGYDVAGVDRSEAMVDRLRAKARHQRLDAREYVSADIRTVNLARRFDVVLMMFAVLGYQLDDADVLAALRTARRHLNTGGLLIFDAWYGPAVVNLRPSPRTKVVRSSEGELERVATAELDVTRRRCTIDYRVHRDEGVCVPDVLERHEVRFFFPDELDAFLKSAGFTLVSTRAFPECDRTPDESTWNFVGVARAS